MDSTLLCGASRCLDTALTEFLSPQLASGRSPLLPTSQEMKCHIFAFQNLNGLSNLKKKIHNSRMNMKQISFEVITGGDRLCVHQLNEALVLFMISFLRDVSER